MKKYSINFAPKYQSRRFPQMGFSSVAYKDDAPAVADPKELKEAIMGELTTIKGALELNQKKELDKQEKNWNEKLEAVTKSIEDLKNVKPEVTIEEIKAIKEDALANQKALDILQTRLKAQKSSGGNQYQPREDLSFAGQVKVALVTKKDEIVSGKIVGKSMEEQMTIKAVGDMTVAASVDTGVVPNTYRSGLVMPPNENIHMRHLVAVTPSDTDSYHFYRFNVGEGSIAFQGQELATKAQIDADLAEQVVNLDYLAGFLKISRKLLRNFNGLQATLSRWLPEQYYEAEDTKAYQALLNAATGVQDSSGTDMLSVIIRTIGKQRKAKYNVNAIVVDGEVWGRILTYKASGSGEFTMPQGIVAIRPDGTLTIAGIPVYTASWVGGDEAIIGDWRYFEIIQSESLSVGFFEQDDKNVQQNKITVRIEASVGFAMLDPKAFVVAALESVS